jgi:RNA recognition motif-containing protein
VNAVSVVHQLTEFHPRTRSWLPTSHTISTRIRYLSSFLSIENYANSLEQLKELFSAYEPTAAKIALRPIPRFMVKKLQARGEQRKGRGFGFVTLASEELQQKACEEMNGKEIEGREIAVKVAIDSPGICPSSCGI